MSCNIINPDSEGNSEQEMMFNSQELQASFNHTADSFSVQDGLQVASLTDQGSLVVMDQNPKKIGIETARNKDRILSLSHANVIRPDEEQIVNLNHLNANNHSEILDLNQVNLSNEGRTVSLSQINIHAGNQIEDINKIKINASQIVSLNEITFDNKQQIAALTQINDCNQNKDISLNHLNFSTNSNVVAMDEDSHTVSLNENDHIVSQSLQLEEVEVNEVIKESLVNSSSLFNSVVKGPDDIMQNRKISNSQVPVVLKLLDDDTLSLDMVRIISDDRIEEVSSNGENICRFSSNNNENQLKLTDEINSFHGDQTTLECTNNQSNLEQTLISCNNIVWECSYCYTSFSSKDGLKKHHERECPQLSNVTSVKNQIHNEATSSNQILNSDIKSINSCKNIPNQIDKIFNTSVSITSIPNYISGSVNKTVDISRNSFKSEQETLNFKSINHNNNKFNKQKNDSGQIDYDVYWLCTICNKEFFDDKQLQEHYMSHNVQDLSVALTKLTPCQHKPKKRKNNFDKKFTDNKQIFINRSTNHTFSLFLTSEVKNHSASNSNKSLCSAEDSPCEPPPLCTTG